MKLIWERKWLRELDYEEKLIKITKEEDKKKSKVIEERNELKNFLLSTMIQKTKEKALQKEADVKEENRTLQNQIKHFEASEKRYKDIFTEIDQKDRKVQESYEKLKFGCKNLALAEAEKDKSIETLCTKQIFQISDAREKYEKELVKRKSKDISKFINFNAFNLNTKNMKLAK